MTRRGFLTVSGSAMFAAAGSALLRAGRQTPRPTPSPSQLVWQQDELALFLHFGINTFTDREWGDGHEDPAVFAPSRLDAREWARVARAAGFRAMILTAKHHDGFCLWPTRTTTHSIASSPWRGGRGDLVREFTAACRAEGLRAGLYLSPWDRHEPSYGDSPRYNAFYCDQLKELLTEYGPIHEVWFDGANGEGPSGRRQQYDWTRIWALVRQLQPNAVIFSDAGPDVRWIGNERGVAGDPNWSTVNPDVVSYPGASGAAVSAMLQHGDPAGSVWRPGETDVSIRPGWFHHPAEDARVKGVDELISIYLSSVGRNSKLLLNVPPTRHGLLADVDVARLHDLRARLDAWSAREIAADRPRQFRATGAQTAVVELDLGRDVSVGLADFSEDIARGQIVARYALEGRAENEEWRTLSTGMTIGARKLDLVAAPPVRHVRLRIESIETPDSTGALPAIRLRVYEPPAA